jgi:SAM-dependent methyltransferase
MRRRLEHAPELLDEPLHERAELEQSLDQVAEVNRVLGGRRAVLRALEAVVPAADSVSILDVGTGSADIPLAIAAWADARGTPVRITAADVHPQMREIARSRTRDRPTITVADADALALPFDADAFDIVLLSLTLHHFDGADQVQVLREAGRVARRAVIVNELERCRANWLGARLLAATRWRGNRITRHDGPLSVLRAFTRAELADAAAAAGLRVSSLRRRFFYRLVLIADTRDA